MKPTAGTWTPPRTRCECGYSLTGLPVRGGLARCPECGRSNAVLGSVGPRPRYRGLRESIPLWPWGVLLGTALSGAFEDPFRVLLATFAALALSSATLIVILVCGRFRRGCRVAWLLVLFFATNAGGVAWVLWFVMQVIASV